MIKQSDTHMRLFSPDMQRLYINREERLRFLKSARNSSPHKRTLCEILTFTGCRISEALSLTPHNFELDSKTVFFRTLKRRGFFVRQLPLPRHLCELMDEVHQIRLAQEDQILSKRPIWHFSGHRISRVTAYRWVKQVMKDANIVGKCASPKGLRHGFGIFNQQNNIQQHYTQKYMGHSSPHTTSIYTTVIGIDEQKMMEKIWDETA